MKVVQFIVCMITTLLITGCNCKPSYMPENFIVKPEDKSLNCQQVIYAINETEFWMKNVHERCKQPHVFSKFLPCTPMVKLDAMRNEYTLSDRASYLRSLYEIKGCDSSLKLSRSSIKKQSNKIGYEINQMKIQKAMMMKQEIVESNGQIIAEIPMNIG